MARLDWLRLVEGAPGAHITYVDGERVHDLYFRRGLALGHRRERSALRPRLVRAWEDGHRRGVLVGLGVVLGLILCARWLGRTRCR